MSDMLTAALCKRYATLLIDARRVTAYKDLPEAFRFARAGALNREAFALYDRAAPRMLPWLDAVKKVLEIDANVTDVTLVLLRASVQITES